MTGDEQHNTWQLMLNAAIDGELDAAGMLSLERQLATDPGLSAEYERLRALRQAFQRELLTRQAPDALRQRMAALADQQAQPTPSLAVERPKPNHRLFGLVAMLLVGVLLGASAAHLLERPVASAQASLADALVDGHRRALLAASSVDVPNGEGHTIKPWLDQRIAISPRVINPPPEGSSVIGARIDVIAGIPVPTIVYRIRAHLISVFALPARLVRISDALLTTRDGYAMVSWPDGNLVYVATADISEAELKAFGEALRTAPGQE